MAHEPLDVNAELMSKKQAGHGQAKREQNLKRAELDFETKQQQDAFKS